MVASAFGQNPVLTTVAAGTFFAQSDGYVQGVMLDNPPDITGRIVQGWLNTTETLPMWGGLPIYEDINTPFGPGSGAPTSPYGIGAPVGRATAVSGGSYPYSGFSIFNQAHAMVTSPQNPVPTAGSGMSVNYARKGSGVRIAVACDPAMASFEGGSILQQCSWDFNNGVLTPYDASTGTVDANSASWATNVYTINVTTASLPWTPVAGDYVNVSGATNSGTGGASIVNGDFQLLSVGTSGSNTLLNITLVAGSGVVGTIGGTIVLNFGTGALPVQILGFNFGGSQTVHYNAAANLATWYYSGSCAVILI